MTAFSKLPTVVLVWIGTNGVVTAVGVVVVAVAINTVPYADDM